MPDITLTQWALGLVAALGIGFAKAGFGGVMLVVVVIMADQFGALHSVGIVLPLLIVADLTAYRMFRTHSNWRAAFGLLIPALPGVAIGYLLLRQLDESSARTLIGWLIVGLLCVKIVLWKWERVVYGEDYNGFQSFNFEACAKLAISRFQAGNKTTMISNAKVLLRWQRQF